MSWENVTTALQVNATTGNGLTLTLPDARFVTFKVQGALETKSRHAVKRNGSL